MKTRLQVLSEEERSRVHEESLDILQHTGVRVQTPLGRQILKDAGALVDESSEVVQFPKKLVEQSLELAPKDFSLGARRPGADLRMNGGGSTLCLDGAGTMALDRDSGERRPATYDDWWNATSTAARRLLERELVPREAIVAISCSAQWAGTVALDRSGQPVLRHPP